METRHYHTTINCQNCIRAVSGFIEDVPNIDTWEVDTDNPNKILTVTGENIDWVSLKEAVLDAGYDIYEIEAPARNQAE